MLARLDVELPLVEVEPGGVGRASNDVIRVSLTVEEDGAVGQDFDELVAEGCAVVTRKLAKELAKVTERLMMVQELGGLNAAGRGLLEETECVAKLSVSAPQLACTTEATHSGASVALCLGHLATPQLELSFVFGRYRPARDQRFDSAAHRIAGHKRAGSHGSLCHRRPLLGLKPTLDLGFLVQPSVAPCHDDVAPRTLSRLPTHRRRDRPGGRAR